MAETVEIMGKVYQLCPFNTGQMRRLVKPFLQMADEVTVSSPAVKVADLPLMMADLVVAALRNGYPHLEAEAVDELTPGEVSEAFAAILRITQQGGKRGEVPAPVEAIKS